MSSVTRLIRVYLGQNLAWNRAAANLISEKRSVKIGIRILQHKKTLEHTPWLSVHYAAHLVFHQQPSSVLPGPRGPTDEIVLLDARFLS